MEGTVGQKEKQHEFTLVSVSDLASSSSESQSKPVVARFSDDSGLAELRFHKESESSAAINVDLRTAQVWLYSLRFCYLFQFFYLLFVWLLRKWRKRKQWKRKQIKIQSIIDVFILYLTEPNKFKRCVNQCGVCVRVCF